MNSDPSALCQGCLLLADPSLHGSYFGRGVILILAHSAEEGTHGYLLNRPSEGRVLRDLLDAPEFKALREVPVYEGGPVSRSELTLVALRWDEAAGRLETRPALGIVGAERALAEGWEVRAFTGYTGWSAGQLERELGQSSWRVVPAGPGALDGGDGVGEGMWAALWRASGDPRDALLADFPDDPSLN